jgi:dihydropteroate synthase
VYADFVESELPTDRPLVMGIINVTPDSFSDGGRFMDTQKAIEYGLAMSDEGADIIDVGGESTRPGSKSISEEEEISRVIPVISALAGKTAAVVSVDTTKSVVAQQAVDVGAGMINDVSTLRGGKELASIAAKVDAKLLIMHSRKLPRNMQEEISYGDVVVEVVKELEEAVDIAREAGVPRDSIWLDPGIGFAKTPEHNLQLLGRLREIVDLGYPVVVGPSRKSFIFDLTGAPVDRRIGGTAAAVTASIMNGARAVRVHDVATMKQVVTIAHGIARGSMSGGSHA